MLELLKQYGQHCVIWSEVPYVWVMPWIRVMQHGIQVKRDTCPLWNEVPIKVHVLCGDSLDIRNRCVKSEGLLQALGQVGQLGQIIPAGNPYLFVTTDDMEPCDPYSDQMKMLDQITGSNTSNWGELHVSVTKWIGQVRGLFGPCN